MIYLPKSKVADGPAYAGRWVCVIVVCVPGSPSGKGVCSLVLPGGVDVANGKVLHDLRHVLVLEERVPAGFVWNEEADE